MPRILSRSTRRVLPADAKCEGKVKVAGTIVKDASNKDYPYMMKAKKVTELKKD